MRVFLENRWKAHKARLARYIDDDDGGTTTIEFVLWLPIFVLILSLVIDVCFVFLGQAVMYDVASDTARRASICQEVGVAGPPATGLHLYAQTEATFLGNTPDVSISEASGAVTVTVEHKLEQIDVVGILGFLSGDTISAVVTQLEENCN